MQEFLKKHLKLSIDDFPYKEIFFEKPFLWNIFLDLENFLKSQSLGKIEIDLPKEVYLENPELISIKKGTTVESGACIQGPCIIGENNIIRHGAYIRGNVITGRDCIIGHATEVKNSIFLDDAKAPHFSYVGDSILGRNVNLGAGTICSNFRLDQGEIVIKIDEKVYKTGLDKLGAIISDETQIGCNTIINPGTIIGKNTICYPNVTISGFIPEGSIVKPEYKTSIMPRQF